MAVQLPEKRKIKTNEKGLTKLISLNSVRPFLSVSHILPDNHRIPDK